MDTKHMCSMGTFLGFIFALQVTALLAPFMSTGILFLGWMLSAVYLRVLPFKEWLKVGLLWDATKLGTFYESVIQTYSLIVQIKLSGEQFLVKTVTEAMVNWSAEEAQNATLVMNNAVGNIRSVNPMWALAIPVLSLFITYSAIGVIYIYLKRIGFYRRILV